MAFNIDKEKLTERFVFDEALHMYFYDGKPMTGVTTILGVIAKPALIQWSANMAVASFEKQILQLSHDGATLQGILSIIDDIKETARYAHKTKKDSAADIGTLAHKWIELWIKGENPAPHPVVSHMTDQFVNWAKANKVKFLGSELRCYDIDNWYAGTCDLVMEIDGKVWIGDIKTSSGIYPSFFFQTAAYQHAMQSMGKYPEVEGHVIINISKDGKLKEQRSYGFTENLKAFVAALTLYRQQETLKNVI